MRLLGLAMVVFGSVPLAGHVPYVPTPAAELSTAALAHQEVLRIDRDFGKAQFEIVLDGWLPRADQQHIEGVRLWWVKTDSADRRKPFSAKVHRYIDFGYDRRDDGGLAVRFSGDRKEFAFAVELGRDGKLGAFADIERDDGTVVPHCRAQRGRLQARRFLGIPVGIRDLLVTCVDDRGQGHRGAVPYRKISRGELYDGR